MTTQAGVRIRLVKCPRCRKILPESPDVSMYKCGWCGIVLQAKNKKPEINQPELPSQETDSAAESQQDNVLGQNEDRSSPEVNFSPDADNIRCEDECDDSMKLSHNRRAYDGLSGSPDTSCPRSENFPSEVEESLGRSPKRYGSKSNDNEKRTSGSNSSSEQCSSGEISLEAEACTSEASEHVGQHNPSQLHRGLSLEEKNGESQSVWPEGDHSVDEVHNLREYEDQESDLPERMDDYVLPPTYSTDQNGESSGEIEPVGPDSASGMNSNENDLVAPSAEPVDDGSKGRRFAAERSKALNLSKGSLESFYLTCDDEEHDLSQSEVDRSFHRINSVDTMGSSHLGDFSSELDIRPGSMAYYGTSRNYYAYDGSESSNDGIDDQVREHVSHPSRKDEDTEELRWDGLSKNITGRNRVRLGLHEDVSRSPFPAAAISGHRHKLRPPRESSCSDPDKMELLRTVYQLRDQLQRMQLPKPMMPHTRFTERGSFSPYSYNLLPSERDIYAGRWHDRSKGCGARYNDPRMAFSGEVSHFRHQGSCSCCPQDWHYSSSPHRYASSEPSSWDCGTKSENQRLAEIKRLQLRERYQTAKRHLRPIAGGAPFIACYHCSQLLQLPVDFLLFKKRRYHKFMCNACQKLLRYSFLKGTTHLIRYMPDASAPPPSEAGDYKHKQPLHHSSSCSYDYGLSFCQSCSTEGEASDHVKRDSTIKERKMKGSVEFVESVGPSSRTRDFGNATASVSEIEELPPLSNPPLHLLFGYSTPSKVLER